MALVRNSRSIDCVPAMLLSFCIFLIKHAETQNLTGDGENIMQRWYLIFPGMLYRNPRMRRQNAEPTPSERTSFLSIFFRSSTPML